MKLWTSLVFCFFLSLVAVFIQGNMGFVETYTWSFAIVAHFTVADKGTVQFRETWLNFSL